VRPASHSGDLRNKVCGVGEVFASGWYGISEGKCFYIIV